MEKMDFKLKLVASNGKRIDKIEEEPDCNYTKTISLKISGVMWEKSVKNIAKAKNISELEALEKIIKCGVIFCGDSIKGNKIQIVDKKGNITEIEI